MAKKAAIAETRAGQARGPDVHPFEATLRRADCDKGVFVSFDHVAYAGNV
jgi:hypothetical protein